MRTISVHEQVIGIPISSIMYPLDQSSPLALLTYTTTQHPDDHKPSAKKRSTVEIVLSRINKLKLGAKMFQFGGVEKIFRRLFCVEEDKQLLMISQCRLSTTAGLISGLFFVSTYKIAFCSKKPIKISSPNGEPTRALYKVVIPVSKIKRVNQHEIVTVDNFDFWFMGFLSYQKALAHIQQPVF